MNKLEELKQSWAEMEDSYKQIRADMPVDPTQDKQNQIMDYMWECMSSLRNQMWDLHDSHSNALANHASPVGKTHPPALNSASAVENYLDACGMTNDYEVKKPSIQVRANRQGNKEFQVELGSTKK
jgi:hypothetical protein